MHPLGFSEVERDRVRMCGWVHIYSMGLPNGLRYPPPDVAAGTSANMDACRGFSRSPPTPKAVGCTLC